MSGGSGSSHDVIVVGAGLVGGAAALGLARAGCRVLLIDRARPGYQAGRLGMDIRNVAVSPGSQALLADLGLWSRLAPAPYRGMRVWEERGTETLCFDAADAGRSELGWIVENGPTLAALWAALDDDPRIEVRLGEITGLDCRSDRVSARIADATCDARLLVGVDGARSAVRVLVGAALEEFPTGHHALATVVRTERAHEGVAYQRFLLAGPLALLPSREARLSSVVWSQPPELAAARRALSDAAFCEVISQASEHRLGRIVAVDERLVFPLQQQLVQDFNPAGRVLLIGDAARVLHPLAGLGANLGFEDVRDLLARFQQFPPGADPGQAGLWRGWARKRHARAQMMIALMASFKQAYADGRPISALLRNSAVGLLNQAKPLKRQLIREALGVGPLASSW